MSDSNSALLALAPGFVLHDDALSDATLVGPVKSTLFPEAGSGEAAASAAEDALAAFADAMLLQVDAGGDDSLLFGTSNVVRMKFRSEPQQGHGHQQFSEPW